MLPLIRRFLQATLAHVIAPAVARTGDLDGAIDCLKQGVAGHISKLDTIERRETAEHVGRSERWVYDQVAKGRQATSAPSQERLLTVVMELLYAASPAALGFGELLGGVQKHLSRVTAQRLESILHLYEEVGFVARVEGGQSIEGEEPSEPSFRAAERVVEVSGADLNQRSARINRSVESILPVAVSYLRGDRGARFGRFLVRLSGDEWVAAMADIEGYTRERLELGTQRCLERDPSEEDAQSYCVILTCGDYDPEPTH